MPSVLAATLLPLHLATTDPAVHEFWVPQPRGREQIVVVDRPLAAGPLRLALVTPGTVEVDADGRGATIHAADGGTQRYEGLIAWDRHGRRLGARLERTGEGLDLVVSTEAAGFPITIDPVYWNVPLATFTGTQSGSRFGDTTASLDWNGDGRLDLAIGAPDWSAAYSQQGAVHLYPGDVGGISEIAQGTRLGSGLVSHFGETLAACDWNGDGTADLAVGEPGWDWARGRVHLFFGAPAGLPGTATMTLEGDVAGDEFGGGLAAAGDTDGDGDCELLVGAPGSDVTFPNGGRVLLFAGTSQGPAPLPSWSFDGHAEGEALGSVLAPAMDLDADGYSDFLVGDPNHDVGTGGEGAVFAWGGGPTLSSSADWSRYGTVPDGHLGYSVAGIGDTNGDEFADVFVGEPGWSDLFTGQGRALLFTGQTFPQYLSGSPAFTTEAPLAGSATGSVVFAPGDLNDDGRGDVLIGSPGYQGSGWIEGFAGWNPPAGLAWMDGIYGSEGNPAGARAGVADVDGDSHPDVLDCRPLSDVLDINRCIAYHGLTGGHVYAVEGSYGSQEGSEFGSVLAVGGDVQADGFDELLLGVPAWDNPAADTGRVVVFAGGPWSLGDVIEADWTANEAGARFGHSLAGGGDMDGDGYDDIAVGAPQSSLSIPGQGRVYFYRGTISGLNTVPWFVDEGVVPDQAQGSSLAMGDLNGDGLAELAVGGPGYEDGGIQGGGVTVWMGAATGPDPNHYGFLEIGQAGAAFGTSLAIVPDMTGDGFGELLVGAPAWDGTETDEGAAFLFPGTADRPDSWAIWLFQKHQGGAQVGASVASAGDVDGDGLGDVVVGAPGWNDGSVSGGWAGVFTGSATGPAMTPAWEFIGEHDGDELGARVAWGGDTNADGLSEVLVGVPGLDPPTGPEGATVDNAGGVRVLGHWDGALVEYAFGTLGLGEDEAMGVGLAGGHDRDGDGYGDIAWGSLNWNGTGSFEGLPGNRVDAPANDEPRRLRLLRGGGQPVGTGGALLGDSVTIRAQASSSWGRTRVRLETEWEATGTDWDGDGRDLSGSYVDSGFQGVSLDATHGGLSLESGWRGRARVSVDPALGANFPQHRWVSAGILHRMPHAWTPAIDTDGDGHRDGADCGPLDPAIHRDAEEVPDDGVDQDCDGADVFTCREDQDGDGAGGAAVGLCGNLDEGCAGCFPDEEGLVSGMVDCDDANAEVTVGTPELCNGVDDDCDGTVPADEADMDQDGAALCLDCDDGDPLRNPALPAEFCDGLDNDCDGLPAAWEADLDGDGLATCEGDCDDSNPLAYPGAPEPDTGGPEADRDCDGVVGYDVDGDGTDGALGDCDDGDATVGPGATELCNRQDDDCDGSFLPGERDDPDQDGALACQDCWEGNAMVFPGAPERCDAIDNDCDGLLGVGEPDADQDGVPACAGDCDDRLATVHAGQGEDCGNGVDDDCDGTVDQDTDGDGDGFGACGEDCDDRAADVHAGAAEICNAIDDDCDTEVDEGFDLDHDGQATCLGDCDDHDASVYRDAPVICDDGQDNDCRPETVETLDIDGDGFVACPPDASLADCWEGNSLVFPGAIETCNHIDDDCDAEADEGWDVDADLWSLCDGDCDDSSVSVQPLAPDLCEDGIDANCDGIDPSCGLADLEVVVPRGCACGTSEGPGGAGWLLAALTLGSGWTGRRRGPGTPGRSTPA